MARLRRGRRGNALVEFVFMLPFFATMLFGAMEFGQVFYSRIQLTNACREGVRRAAVGKPLATIRSAAQNGGTGLNLTTGQLAVEYNTALNGSGSWVAVANDAGGTSNTVPVGYLIRVRVTGWSYRFMTGSYFNWLPGASNGSLPMSSQEIMARE